MRIEGIPSVVSGQTLSSTVPRELVHRAALAEVFVTGWTRLGAEDFRVTAQWPRSHVLFAPLSRGRHDPLIVAESIRQAGMVIAHAEYRIPVGYHFVLTQMGHTVLPEGLEVGSVPQELTLDLSCSDISRRGQRVSGFRVDATIWSAEGAVATGYAAFVSMAPAVYERLRGARLAATPPSDGLAPPISPQLVGRNHPMEVVLAPTESEERWEVRTDARHPILFDHPVDHIPGMVLLEAAQQAAAARAYPLSFEAVSMESVFHRYAEFDTPCVITADGETDDPACPGVHVKAHQNGSLLFESTLRRASSLPSDQK
ncbi:ScbA/BarX family gamma-butyrolactone biosynthesis protein [Streptomyces sp. NPDC002845]